MCCHVATANWKTAMKQKKKIYRGVKGISSSKNTALVGSGKKRKGGYKVLLVTTNKSATRPMMK